MSLSIGIFNCYAPDIIRPSTLSSCLQGTWMTILLHHVHIALLFSDWNRHLRMGAPIRKIGSWALVLPLVSSQLDLLEHGRLPLQKCDQVL